MSVPSLVAALTFMSLVLGSIGSGSGQSVDWTGVHQVVPASAVTVVDGDTIKFEEGSEYIVVRLIGIDAPEIHGAACQRELELGLKAKARASELIHAAGSVTLMKATDRPRDKYGRMLAKIMLPSGPGLPTWQGELGDILLRESLVVPYSGRTKRKSWCVE